MAAVIAAEMNFGVYRDNTGRYRWRLWSGLRLQAASSESFENRRDAEHAALDFRVRGRDTSYETVASGGSWYWRARDRCGEPVAITARPFDSRFNAEHAADYMSKHVAQATFL